MNVTGHIQQPGLVDDYATVTFARVIADSPRKAHLKISDRFCNTGLLEVLLLRCDINHAGLPLSTLSGARSLAG